ncbi:MAG: biopolymer transporter ExbD [Bacteroidota bacterium]
MPKVKPKRHVPTVDMTAMVDVAFLLLTFFILTAKFRAEEKQPVDTPSAESISKQEIKEHEMFLIKVGQDGRIFVGLGDIPTRLKMLDRLSSSFNLQISEQGRAFFQNTQEFGVPINELPSWLNQPNTEAMKNYPHNGIPVDKRRGRLNELREYIQAARRANLNLKFAIKGDRDVVYEHMDKVIYTLQDVKINRFNLITKLEGDPNAKAAAGGGGEGEAH